MGHFRPIQVYPVSRFPWLMASSRTVYLWPILVAGGVILITGMASRTPVRPPVAEVPAAALTSISTASASVDEQLQRQWDDAGIQSAEPADDLTILRRLSLALLGTIPSLEEIRLFEADARPDRLDHWTAAMLEDARFAAYFSERLARGFVGVEEGQFLIFRRDRFKDWLATQLREHRPYDQIVREMISGQGVWTGEGEVNFVTAGFANDEFDANKLTARTARAFLGQRIDCAQCHDHPFDHWKQKDFEGLAAHFGQLQLSLAGVVDHPHAAFQIPEDMHTLLTVGPMDESLRRFFGKQKKGVDEQAHLKSAGTDAWLVAEPVKDENSDDTQMMEGPAKSERIRFVIRRTPDGVEVYEREGEYFVEDTNTLEDRLVTPNVPFHSEWLGTTGTRRERLAAWVTHPENQRFERAIANRVWGLMFGKPFLTDRPVDDLPDPQTDESLRVLDLLGQDFRENGYDLRRLVQVIAATKAFRQQSMHPLDTDDPAAVEADEEGMPIDARVEVVRDAWAVFPLVRLRPEQVIGAMLQANNLHTIDQNSHLFTRLQRFIRERDFVNEFGDPGVDELLDRAGTIPQALLRMNGEFAKEMSEATPFSASGRVSMVASSPEHLVETLYLVCLTRRPTPEEKSFFLAEEDLKADGDLHSNAVQDIVWTLYNSPEFSWNH